MEELCVLYRARTVDFQYLCYMDFETTLELQTQSYTNATRVMQECTIEPGAVAADQIKDGHGETTGDVDGGVGAGAGADTTT